MGTAPAKNSKIPTVSTKKFRLKTAIRGLALLAFLSKELKVLETVFKKIVLKEAMLLFIRKKLKEPDTNSVRVEDGGFSCVLTSQNKYGVITDDCKKRLQALEQEGIVLRTTDVTEWSFNNELLKEHPQLMTVISNAIKKSKDVSKDLKQKIDSGEIELFEKAESTVYAKDGLPLAVLNKIVEERKGDEKMAIRILEAVNPTFALSGYTLPDKESEKVTRFVAELASEETLVLEVA